MRFTSTNSIIELLWLGLLCPTCFGQLGSAKIQLPFFHKKTASGQRSFNSIILTDLSNHSENAGGVLLIINRKLTTDISKPVASQNHVFDKMPIGIVRLDNNRRISYANQNFKDLLGLGCKDWQEMNFDDLLLDEGNRAILDEQLKFRAKGKSSEYKINLRRPDDGRNIPVNITASPETDLKGKVIGSMGIIRSISRERILQKIESHKTAAGLIHAVADELKAVVPYEGFSIALFSPDGNYVCGFYRDQIQTRPKITKRWWEMTPAMKTWASEKKIRVIENIDKFYDQPEFKHLAETPEICHLRKTYRSFIHYPVFEHQKLVACVGLYSGFEKPYTLGNKRLLELLPLNSAVLSAIHLDKIETMRFNVNLFKKISSKKESLDDIAKIITKEISKFYQWENVSIFRVDLYNRRHILMHQAVTEDSLRSCA